MTFWIGPYKAARIMVVTTPTCILSKSWNNLKFIVAKKEHPALSWSPMTTLQWLRVTSLYCGSLLPMYLRLAGRPLHATFSCYKQKYYIIPFCNSLSYPCSKCVYILGVVKSIGRYFSFIVTRQKVEYKWSLFIDIRVRMHGCVLGCVCTRK